MKASPFALTAAGCAFAFAQTSLAQVIAGEDFDGGALNLTGTSNVFDFGAGGGVGGDVFGRVSPFFNGGTGMPFDVADDSVADVSGGGVFATDTISLIGQNSTAIFAMNDMDGVLDGSGAPLNDATWSFDISAAMSITNISIDIGALGDFEAASEDGFRIDAQLDGGGYVTIFQAITNEALFKDYRPNDIGNVFSDDDPLELFIDGSATAVGTLDKSDAATGLMDTYLSTLFAGASGSNLDIRVSWSGTPSGSEPMGIDNIIINGAIPAPGVLALLGVAGLAARRRRRG